MNAQTPERNCDSFCVSGEQFRAAMEMLGIWFEGNILSVVLENRTRDIAMAGHSSEWYAKVEVHESMTSDHPYSVRSYYIPVHTYSTLAA